MKKLFSLLLIYCAIQDVHSQSTAQKLKALLDSVYSNHPNTNGIMVSVISPKGDLLWDYAVGYADKKTKSALSPGQPVLIASNTKTYVSATVMVLLEKKMLQLSDPIDKYLSEERKDRFSEIGYDLNEIKVKHLLSHTSGIADYVNDEYIEFVNTNRQHKWTRNEQIELSLKVGKPIAFPGDTFKYADVNYLLLTEIIESVTEKEFYFTMRELLKYNKLKLRSTWFVDLEPKPLNSKPLAHQYWSKYDWDSYDLDPSWDLYGGGGIAATPSDVALFFQHLFDGNIIADTNVLSKMYADSDTKAKTNYCLGLRKITIAGLTAYYHGGFWGTDAVYFPELNTSVCIVILEKSERNISSEICTKIAEILKDQND